MVSIVIPVYQVSDYIERCIRSVMVQTFTDIECIIVDDATEDDSIEKCERLIGEYNGSISFRILHHEENRGLSSARNTGAKAAIGDWIYFIDSDDEITIDCLEKLITIAQDHPDAEMVLGNTQKHHEDGRVTEFIKPDVPSQVLTNKTIFSMYQQHRLLVNAWNILIKRSFIEGHCLFFKEGIIYEDRLWFFYVVKALSKLYICKDITYHYYIRPGSICTGAMKIVIGESFSVIYNEVLSNLQPGGENAELNFYAEGFCRHYLEFKKEIPIYKSLMNKFVRCSREYRNKSVSMKLALTFVMSLVPGGLKVLQSLRKLKNR